MPKSVEKNYNEVQTQNHYSMIEKVRAYLICQNISDIYKCLKCITKEQEMLAKAKFNKLAVDTS